MDRDSGIKKVEDASQNLKCNPLTRQLSAQSSLHDSTSSSLKDRKK
jgi:hypothetical protein